MLVALFASVTLLGIASISVASSAASTSGSTFSDASVIAAYTEQQLITYQSISMKRQEEALTDLAISLKDMESKRVDQICLQHVPVHCEKRV